MAKQSNWQAWALGVFVSLSGAFGAYAWADVKADIQDLSGVRERVSVVETRQTEQQQRYAADLAEIRERLTRIEQQQIEILQALARVRR